MTGKRKFDIAFVGLKPGTHEFEYEIDDKFFIDYQEQDFRKCKAQVKLTLDKKAGFMLLKFEVGGKLEAPCDRCGNDLPLQYGPPISSSLHMRCIGMLRLINSYIQSETFK